MPTCRARSEPRASRRWLALWAGICLLLALPAVTGAADANVLREQAAEQMRRGDVAALQRSFEQLLALERSPRSLNDLGLLRSDLGDFESAQQLLGEAVALAPADQRGLYQANLALNLRRQFRDAEAEQLLQRTMQEIERYDGPRNGWRLCNLSRSRAVARIQLSRIAERQGALDAALAHARAAQQAAADAQQHVPPQATAAERQWVAADLANALRREAHVHIQAQQPAAAEAAIARWRAAAEQHRLGVVVQAQTHAAEAMLAMTRQRFAEAAAAAQQADARYAAAQLAAGHLSRIAVLETRLTALWAAGQAEQGRAVLKTFDEATAAHHHPAAPTQMALARGLIALDSGQHAKAARLFQTQQQQLRASGGAASLAHTEAVGLQGVALWAQPDATARVQARALLRQAADELLTPLNAAAPDGSGLRALIRRRVVDAYVASQLEGSAAPDLRVATLLDWLAEGAVQRAVTQAAARMAIPDPALRDLARREQDLRRAVDALSRTAGGLAGVGEDESRTPPATSAAAQQRLQALRTQWAELATELRSRFPAYAGLTQPLPPTLERVSMAMAPGEALLVISHREQESLLWLLRADGRHQSRRVELAQARALALVQAVRSTLEFPERGRLPAFDRRAAGELHRALIEPLQEALQGVQHLAVISSGPLAALPFALLAPDDGRNSAEANWLIRRTAISQNTSLSAWLAARRAARPDGDALTLLGWGDPQFGAVAAAAPPAPLREARATRAFVAAPAAGSGRRESPDPGTAFARLPDTRDELLAIAQALGADPGRSLRFGRDATRSSILEASRSGALAQARIVAFATHGLKAGEWPGLEQPALVMAIPEAARAGQATEHMLSLDDALSLQLDADWVILSACNTTAGDQEAGEALSGLARGMFYAGARGLLATHWAVESRSAAQLVKQTFRHYAEPARPGKAEALRKAMLQLLAQPGLAHPAYWAPYVVIGDGGR